MELFVGQRADVPGLTFEDEGGLVFPIRPQMPVEAVLR
jgi:hypothetical protein